MIYIIQKFNDHLFFNFCIFPIIYLSLKDGDLSIKLGDFSLKVGDFSFKLGDFSFVGELISMNYELGLIIFLTYFKFKNLGS